LTPVSLTYEPTERVSEEPGRLARRHYYRLLWNNLLFMLLIW
jgi:hypothetical protein